MFSRIFTLALLVLALSGCAKPPYNNLDNEQLQSMLEQGTPIYDIRRPDEWHQTGVIADSQLMTFVDAGVYCPTLCSASPLLWARMTRWY
jgi:hypothetical protein